MPEEKERACKACSTPLGGWVQCQICGEVNRPSRVPAVPKRFAAEPTPVIWAKGSIRVRAPGGGVREITVPMPQDTIKDDSTCLMWLSRPTCS
mmetsp:Transcript_1344/g.3414  ORF Transcript_1344/g.3414 Transcript_1344/m.3414 type:complete len:93 (-) Transcript_1344:42-320(-)